jgi:hypothetical protein
MISSSLAGLRSFASASSRMRAPCHGLGTTSSMRRMRLGRSSGGNVVFHRIHGVGMPRSFERISPKNPLNLVERHYFGAAGVVRW